MVNLREGHEASSPQPQQDSSKVTGEWEVQHTSGSFGRRNSIGSCRHSQHNNGCSPGTCPRRPSYHPSSSAGSAAIHRRAGTGRYRKEAPSSTSNQGAGVSLRVKERQDQLVPAVELNKSSRPLKSHHLHGYHPSHRIPTHPRYSDFPSFGSSTSPSTSPFSTSVHSLIYSVSS